VIQVQQKDVFDVTVSGSVVNEQGGGINGAVVTDGKMSTTTDAAGQFTLGPVKLSANESVALSAAYQDGQTTYSGGPVTRVFDGQTTAIAGVVITVQKPTASVTISGRVQSRGGMGVGGASVSTAGASASTDGSGYFTLGPVGYQPGGSLNISASAPRADGSTGSGNASVTPTSDQITGVVISIDLEVDQAGDDIDDAIDDMVEEVDDGADFDALLAELDLLVAELDGIAADFNDQASFFEQRMRELMQDTCKNSEVVYSLTAAKAAADDYSFALPGTYGLYGELVAAQMSHPERNLADADAKFLRVSNQEATIQARYAQMQGLFASYECDEDRAEVDAGDRADDQGDPDDLGTIEPEACGDGIDNDKDGQIDECDAGCCNKNVQITVTDCGPAADDIFEVALNGERLGVTPKGTANTWNRELEPGAYVVTITCLDDGGVPPGTDIGTSCVNIVVYGTAVAIGGGAPSIAYGGSATVSFEVPEGPAAAKLNRLYDGAIHRARGLEPGH
jgi:hypothetical protein